MADEPVRFEVKDKIAQITLNRPDNRNSMNHETIPAFREVIAKASQEKDLRCVIVTGSGKTFCAGADFRSDVSGEKDLLPNEVAMGIYRPFLSIRELSVPTIAAVNGHAIGGGFGIALQCDIRIANKEAKLGANFGRLGLHSGMAISYMLPRLVGLARASELLYTGQLITGARAADMGLVNYALDPDKVLDKAWEMAGDIAACAPVAVKMMKRSVYQGLALDSVAAAEMESHCQSRTLEMEDAKEGIRALLEKREPEFHGR